MKLFRSAVVALIAGMIAGLSLISPAHASVQTDFIAKLVPGAQALQRSTGIPASVTIGMAALESGWGRSKMAGSATIDGKVVAVNTLFNIKCTSTPSPYQTGCAAFTTAEYTVAGVRYTEVAKFRTYADWNGSMNDYGRLLTTASRYKPAFNYTNNPDQFVTEVRKAGYATDPNYASLVISIMKRWNLYQYNTVAAAPDATPSATPAPPAAAPAPSVPAATVEAGFPTLRIGSRGEAVKTLQRFLNVKNAAGLAVDGAFGAVTAKAVRAYQLKARLTVTGQVDTATWRALLPTVQRGSRGIDVVLLQQEMTAAGFWLAADGAFGAKTTAVVKQFQAKYSLGADGVVGPRTWAALVRL